MTKRIFQAICLVAIAVFFVSSGLLFGVLYGYFGNVQKNQLKTQTELAARGVEAAGSDYFKGLDTTGYRITWVSADGDVLFDSEKNSANMENHRNREEIDEALASGYGESTRYSVTLLERTLYRAVRLSDGTVLRLSVAQRTRTTLLIGIAQPLLITIALAVGVSLWLAYRLSEHITAPLNRLNLSEPLNNEGYEELSPLFHRIDAQQRQIKQQENELRQKQEEFEAVTENMAEGIVLLNTKGQILGINPAAARLFETTRNCVGSHISTVNHSAALSDFFGNLQNGARAEKTVDIHGKKYQFSVSPVTSAGKQSGAVLLALDVTEKERAEQMRREFTANVSHELKTPLHTIAGCAELLENHLVQEADTDRFYAQIHSEAKRMIALIEDIIRLSHLDEGADDMRRETVDLYALTLETVDSLRQVADHADISVRVTGAYAPLYGIPALLQSIVYNLTDNAIKYNRPGGSVSVRVEPSDGEVRLCVADTGIGIPLKHRERIFERFYRIDKSRSKELGGTGLGLSIVKHAARLHGAKIDLQSVENEGTTITVRFP